MKKWLPWFIFLVFGFFLLKPNFSASFGMIDDHEIPLFLGSDGRIKITEMPALIMSTEVGEYGQTLRFRPSYIVIRVLETALWRDNVQLWYISRYAMIVIAMATLYLIINNFFPQIISYLTVFYVFTLPFWPDILNRLGPSEIYAVPALMLFLYGFIKQIRNQGGLSQLFLGYLVCVGSKENLVILMPILFLLAGIRAWRRQLTLKEILTYSGLILFTIWIILGIVIATNKIGKDVYGTKISYTERLMELYKYKRYIFETQHLHFVTLTMMIGVWQFIKHRSKIGHLLVMLVLLFILASQYIFYNNSLPTYMRYDFPGMLLFPTLQMTALHYLLSILPKNIWSLIIKYGTYYCLVIFLITIILMRGYGHIVSSGMKNAKLTSDYANKLVFVVDKLRKYPDWPLVFISDYYLDFEPIVATQRFLVAKNIKNKLMLDYRENELENDNTLMIELLPRLYSVEKIGSSEKIFENFSPLSVPSDGKCFSVTFNKEFVSPCVHLVSF